MWVGGGKGWLPLQAPAAQGIGKFNSEQTVTKELERRVLSGAEDEGKRVIRKVRSPEQAEGW